MISTEEYNILKATSDRHSAWLKARNYKSYKSEEVPADCQITNEELSLIEFYEWKTSPPNRYFLYVNEDTGRATNFMGEVLGDICFGRTWRDNFGGQRQAVKVYGNNGKNYHGTYYKSSGTYARIKMAKRQ